MYSLFSIFNQYEFKTKEKCNMFDKLVSSVLNYCSEVWGANDGKDIELVHTKFCRKILIVNRSTNLEGLYGELGRIPLKIIRKINMIRYWIRIIKLNDNSTVKIVYNMLKNDANNNMNYNGHNWASEIKNILESLGMANLWVNQEHNNDLLLKLIKERILDQYKQSWYSAINNSQRLISYCRFKHDLN